MQFCLHCTVYTGCTLYIVQLLLLNKCYICGDSSCLSLKSSNLHMKNLTFSSLWIRMLCLMLSVQILYVYFFKLCFCPLFYLCKICLWLQSVTQDAWQQGNVWWLISSQEMKGGNEILGFLQIIRDFTLNWVSIHTHFLSCVFKLKTGESSLNYTVHT